MSIGGVKLDEVTFAWPFVLLALVGIPLLLVLYGLHGRRVRARLATFTNPDLLPNLVGRRSRWRRHVAPIVLLAALASLTVGAARPERTVMRPSDEASLVLAIDTSRSMTATDVKPSRLAAAKAAARTVIESLPGTGKVGIVGFTRDVTVLNAPTDDRGVIATSLRVLQVGGGTAVGDAIVQSLKLLGGQAAQAANPARAIVILSDGASTEGHVGPYAAAAQAKQAGVPVYTITLGTSTGSITDPSTGKTLSVAPDAASLKAVAKAGGGQAYTAKDAAQLRRVYDRIARRVGFHETQQDLSVPFIGASTLLVLAAAGASLLWFRRLA